MKEAFTTESTEETQRKTVLDIVLLCVISVSSVSAVVSLVIPYTKIKLTHYLTSAARLQNELC